MMESATFSGVSGMVSGHSFSTGRPRLRLDSSLVMWHRSSIGNEISVVSQVVSQRVAPNAAVRSLRSSVPPAAW